MIDVFDEVDGPVLAIERVPREDVSSYGIIDAEEIRPGVYRIRDLVEKPPRDEAPSDLAIIGRYILTPDIFPALAATVKRSDRRDPADQRAAAAAEDRARSTAATSTASATTPATSSGSSRRWSTSRCDGRTSSEEFREYLQRSISSASRRCGRPGRPAWLHRSGSGCRSNGSRSLVVDAGAASPDDELPESDFAPDPESVFAVPESLFSEVPLPSALSCFLRRARFLRRAAPPSEDFFA